MAVIRAAAVSAHDENRMNFRAPSGNGIADIRSQISALQFLAPDTILGRAVRTRNAPIPLCQLMLRSRQISIQEAPLAILLS
jgi:hypothetical protein